MNTAIWVVFFIIGAISPVWARLGENTDQLIARYGTPLASHEQARQATNPSLTFLLFQRTGYEIRVSLSRGFSVAESFKKLNGAPLSTRECRILLADNAQGYPWEAPQVISGQVKWTRDDGTTAVLTGGRILDITSQFLLARETNEQNFEDEPSLSGF
ncbi:MAG TPA: hypothetical protein VL981_14120 [Candidatus Methylacidiphilales bacterium]|nr:hypothetical protein [Candidatus Methylacidiphilales bacterium]